MTRHTLYALMLLLLFSVTCYAQSACPEFYAGGLAPVILNPKMAPKAQELCNDVYAVEHSGITRTPLWAAEHLTREQLQAGKGLPRSNKFRPDHRLRAADRAELRDYARSGYDRGHMANAADAWTAEGKDQTFFLSNMIPQDPENNRHLWEGIESAVRNLTMRRGELYVISGPLFTGDRLQMLNGRVMIPTMIFKAVLDPATRQAAAYLVDNTATSEYRVISIAELERLAGVEIFPALGANERGRAMKLPAPRPYRGKTGGDDD